MKIHKPFVFTLECSIFTTESETVSILKGDIGLFVEQLDHFPTPEDYFMYALRTILLYPDFATNLAYLSPHSHSLSPSSIYVGIHKRLKMVFLAYENDKYDLFKYLDDPTKSPEETS